MKLGLFMMPLHPPEKSRTECFEEDIEFVIRAEDLGFVEGWFGQHHSLGWEPIPSNDIFISTLIPHTKTMKLGTGVSIVPQHHPVNIAIRAAFLDHLSRGRIMCGFGQGGVPTDWELFNLPDGKTQGLMTVEGIDLIHKLWTTDVPFEFKGQFWQSQIKSVDPVLGLGTFLQPYQKPHPPVAMSMVKGGSMAARMAGQRGYIPISSNLVPREVVVNHWQVYSGGAAEAGRTPDRNMWRVSRSIFIAETNEEAWKHALSGTLCRGFEYLAALMKATNMLSLWKGDPNMPDSEVTPEYALRRLCIIGDPTEVTRQLNELYQETGGFGTLLMIAHDWDDKAKWLRSMELLAKEVVPALPNL